MFVELVTINQLPNDHNYVSDLRSPPKTIGEGAWIIFILCIPVSLYFLRGLAAITIDTIKSKKNIEALEDKQELAEREALVKSLQSQLQYAQKQNAILINELMILRRTMEFSGDYTPREKYKQ